jgi:LysR family transcriptional regulator (chromosome initiation inhibitor)
MLDYKGIEALYMVQKLQSFEAAAEKLHLTQSAISQRIKVLEAYYGEPLLIRSLPYRPTQLGEQLIGLFKRVCLLEEDFSQELKEKKMPFRCSIALNRDSLETYFLSLLQHTTLFKGMILEIIADDQEKTLEYLKNGLANIAISTSSMGTLGSKTHFLGDMDYILVASPELYEQYFSKLPPSKALYQAPALKYDQHDTLHHRYLEKFFNLTEESLQYLVIPSVQGFKQCALQGYAYGLIPKIDVEAELTNKTLIQLYRECIWKVPLYLHYFSIQSKHYESFILQLAGHIQRYLTH